MPPWLEVVPVERPGRGQRTREPHLRELSQLVPLLTEQIMQARPVKYALFGHSLGGLLAFSCAHRLRDLGFQDPVAMAVAGSVAPSKRDDDRLASLTTDKQLVDELRQLEGTPPEVYADPDLLRITLDATAADFSVCASYRYEALPPLTFPIFVFGGRDDDVTLDELSAWTMETVADATYEMFDGGHFFLRRDESKFLEALASKLASTFRMDAGRSHHRDQDRGTL